MLNLKSNLKNINKMSFKEKYMYCIVDDVINTYVAIYPNNLS